MVDVSVRHAEPHDAEALHRILSGPRAIEGTLQLPLQSVEKRREWLSEMPEGFHHLVACVEGEVVGSLRLRTFPTLWRRRHVAEIGMAVRDDWQGRQHSADGGGPGPGGKLAQPHARRTHRVRRQRRWSRSL
jgi:putative acetyltransferase